MTMHNRHLFSSIRQNVVYPFLTGLIEQLSLLLRWQGRCLIAVGFLRPAFAVRVWVNHRTVVFIVGKFY